jgi:hypothetical protein
VGQVLLRQEKFAEALGHFRAAAAIHPASSVLRCCCGAALHKMGRLEEAAQQLRVRGWPAVCGGVVCVPVWCLVAAMAHITSPPGLGCAGCVPCNNQTGGDRAGWAQPARAL